MRAVKVVVLGLIAAMAMAAPAMAGTLDRSQTQFNGGFAVGSGFDEAQTFTAGLSGGLDQADLLLSRSSGACAPDVDLTVEIRTVVGQIPSDVVLASAIVPASSIPANASPGFVPVLFASPADVVAGTQYALVASANGPDCVYEWRGSDTDPYSGGTRVVRSASEPAWEVIPGEDLAFRTYVLVAAPPPPPILDTDPPQTTITKGAPAKTDKAKVKFKFRSDEAGSTFECKLDKGPFKPCTSPKTVKRLDEGKHQLKVRAIDAAGNVDSTPDGDKFKVVG